MLIDSQTLLFPKPIICNIILIDNKNKNNKYTFHSHFIFFVYPLYNFRFIHIISIYPNNRVCSKFRYRKKSICTRGYASLLYLAVVYRQNSSLPFDQAIYTNNGSSQQQEIRNFRQHGARRRCAKGSSGSKARGNYKTTTPTVSTFIMSTSTDVTLFGNHPARHLCFGIYIYIYIPEPPLGLLYSLHPCFFSGLYGEIRASNLFRLGELLPFAGFSISFGHFAKLSCCTGSLARMPRITVS